MRVPLLLGVLALAAPLSAESAPKPVPQPSAPSAPQGGAEAVDQSAAKPSATPIAVEAATPQPQMSIDEKVGADWSRYDTGGKGHLTRAELDKWLIDLRAAAGDTAPDAKWLGTAFGQTDANKDKKVSREELTAFLSSGR
jgi:hypothetical protein